MNGYHILAKSLPCYSDVQTVCLRGSMLPLGHPAPQFGDSFPEKQLKIVATRGDIFSLKFTKYRLAAGLCPDPLGEPKRFPDPLYL